MSLCLYLYWLWRSCDSTRLDNERSCMQYLVCSAPLFIREFSMLNRERIRTKFSSWNNKRRFLNYHHILAPRRDLYLPRVSSVSLICLRDTREKIDRKREREGGREGKQRDNNKDSGLTSRLIRERERENRGERGILWLCSESLWSPLLSAAAFFFL